MTKAEKLFHKIATELPEATEGQMFGAKSIKAPNGKALALFWKDDMIFKLDAKSEKEALSLYGAKQFDPMGGKPMSGWVQLHFQYADKWPGFAKKAMAFVKTQPKAKTVAQAEPAK